jgi:hypothetical protein
LIHRKSIRVRRFHSSRTSRTFDGEDWICFFSYDQ